MIFWTTVLTFMIGLMITMLFPRSDRVDIEELPVSESFVASFAAQHQFARDYSDQISFTLPYIKPVSGSDKPSGDAAHFHIFKDEFDIETGYMPDIMPFQLSHETFPKNGSYTSAIVCMDGIDKTITSGEMETKVYGNVVSCQTSAQTFKYILTYGALFPQNSIQHNLYKRRLDTTAKENEIQRNHILWEKALAKRTKGDPDCGYIDLENNLPYIFSVDGQKRRIPYNLYKVFSLNSYFPAENEYDYQPVFCITPVNSPYVTEGLIYHFDSIMNNKTEAGAPIHSDSKDGWIDIISQSEINFTGTSASTNWNPNEGTPLAFMGDIYLDLPISTSAKEIKSEFTFSFVVNFDQYDQTDSIVSKAPLFSTDTSSYPYVLAMYDKGKLTVTLYKGKDLPIGEVSATIPYNITSISYVVGSRFHHLFVNGTKADTETFANDVYFDGLSAHTLHIATATNTSNKLNADMYNIKIYNRALNQDEIKHNLKTEKKRYNF